MRARRTLSAGRAGCLALLALAAAGCGLPAVSPSAPPATNASARTTPTGPLGTGPVSRGARTPLAIAQATHEYPGAPVHETATAPAAGPVDAVRAFASAYINWDARSVAGDMERLAADSIGQARSAMQLAAAQTAQDYELVRAGVANQGTVEAIGPLSGHPGQYAVVTLERTTAANSTMYAGLAAAWHVAIATVAALGPGRWVLSGWQPEN